MRNMLLIVVLPLAAGITQAQNVVGDWHGTVHPGDSDLHLILHITKGQHGDLKATIDRVDEGAMDIPVKSVVLKGSELTLDVEAVRGSYKGTVNMAQCSSRCCR